MEEVVDDSFVGLNPLELLDIVLPLEQPSEEKAELVVMWLVVGLHLSHGGHVLEELL